MNLNFTKTINQALWRFAVVFCVALVCDGCAFPETSSLIKTGNDSFVRYVLTPPNGPPVEYYLSKPTQRSPLVIYVQGSGCTPVFPATGYGTDHASTIFSSTTMARRYPVSVMVINKPYAPKVAPSGRGVATNCPQEFNAYFSLESWVKQIELAIGHARHLAWVDPRRTIVIGVSEGATVAAALASRNATITDVALVGGSGPTQFYDFVAGAYSSSQDHTKVLAAIEEFNAKYVEIMASPESTNQFMWGHTYKRWSTFFASSSVDNLARSAARVYVVSGMADTSVPILSTEVIAAELRTKGHDITMRRIPNSNHALMREGVSIEEVEGEFDRILRWFLRK